MLGGPAERLAKEAPLGHSGWMDGVRAAVAAARRLGIGVTTPVVLRATNNVVVWLRPSAVVAKVGSQGSLARELAIAGYLVDRGAPVVGPSAQVSPVVHVEDGFAVSFWEYVPQRAGVEPCARSVASSLHRLHRTLRDLPTSIEGEVPSFSWELDHAYRCLGSSAFAPELGDGDRHALRTAIERWLPDLEARAARRIVIHGAPHRLNVLSVGSDARFIDFETICVGPVEWDLAHLEDEVAAAYPEVFGAEALRIARLLVSAKTATWCWAADPSNEEMRWHAQHHLDIVKEAGG